MTDTEKFEREAGRLWNAGTDALDAGTRSKLNQRRQAALDTLGKPAGFNYWIPAAGVAAAVAVTWVWFGATYSAGPALFVEETGQPDDIEIILAEPEFDVLAELEFYAWLDEADTDAT